jgi:hypothetical protein
LEVRTANEVTRRDTLDYPKLVRLVAPKAPLILEHAGTKDYVQALNHPRATMKQAGLAEA